MLFHAYYSVAQCSDRTETQHNCDRMTMAYTEKDLWHQSFIMLHVWKLLHLFATHSLLYSVHLQFCFWSCLYLVVRKGTINTPSLPLHCPWNGVLLGAAGTQCVYLLHTPMLRWLLIVQHFTYMDLVLMMVYYMDSEVCMLNGCPLYPSSDEAAL